MKNKWIFCVYSYRQQILSTLPKMHVKRCIHPQESIKKKKIEKQSQLGGKKGAYKAFKPPHHSSGPCYSGPPRNPLIPPALCALDSFMSSLWEMRSGHRGEGVWRKKILICLWLWKNMHIHLAFRFSKGRTEEMGTCQAPHYGGAAAWLHVHVTVCTCLWEGAIFLLLNDPVFSRPPVCTSAVTIVILMVPPQQKGHVCYPTLLISTWQSAAAADRALLSLAEG